MHRESPARTASAISPEADEQYEVIQACRGDGADSPGIPDPSGPGRRSPRPAKRFDRPSTFPRLSGDWPSIEEPHGLLRSPRNSTLPALGLDRALRAVV